MTAEGIRFKRLIRTVRASTAIGLIADTLWIMRGSVSTAPMMGAMLLFVLLVVLFAYSLHWKESRRMRYIAEAIEEAQDNGPHARLSGFEKWLISESLELIIEGWDDNLDRELNKLLGR